MNCGVGEQETKPKQGDKLEWRPTHSQNPWNIASTVGGLEKAHTTEEVDRVDCSVDACEQLNTIQKGEEERQEEEEKVVEGEDEEEEAENLLGKFLITLV